MSRERKCKARSKPTTWLMLRQWLQSSFSSSTTRPRSPRSVMGEQLFSVSILRLGVCAITKMVHPSPNSELLQRRKLDARERHRLTASDHELQIPDVWHMLQEGEQHF